MELSQKKIEELISAADAIIAANSKDEQQDRLFGDIKDPTRVREILDLPLQDPDKSHKLYYKNIQKFLNKFLPKGDNISTVIRELVCILLTHRERQGLTYGVRGADSRMSLTEDMEHMIDVLSEWSETPTDYFRLATILLNKCKELGYIPQDREVADYYKRP